MSSFSSFVLSEYSSTISPKRIAFHGSKKPLKRSFGYFSRPLLEDKERCA